MEVVYFQAAWFILVSATLLCLLLCKTGNAKGRSAGSGKGARTLHDQAVSYNDDEDFGKLIEMYDGGAAAMESDADKTLSSVSRRQQMLQRDNLQGDEQALNGKHSIYTENVIQASDQPIQRMQPHDQTNQQMQTNNQPNQQMQVNDQPLKSEKDDSRRPPSEPDSQREFESLKDVLPAPSFREVKPKKSRRDKSEKNVQQEQEAAMTLSRGQLSTRSQQSARNQQSARVSSSQTQAPDTNLQQSKESRTVIHSKLSAQQQHTPKTSKVQRMERAIRNDAVGSDASERENSKEPVPKARESKSFPQMMRLSGIRKSAREKGLMIRGKSMALLSRRNNEGADDRTQLSATLVNQQIA